MSLIFGNVSADDILIKDELDALVTAHPTRFRVCQLSTIVDMLKATR